jgi:hypothetical protein
LYGPSARDAFKYADLAESYKSNVLEPKVIKLTTEEIGALVRRAVQLSFNDFSHALVVYRPADINWPRENRPQHGTLFIESPEHAPVDCPGGRPGCCDIVTTHVMRTLLERRTADQGQLAREFYALFVSTPATRAAAGNLLDITLPQIVKAKPELTLREMAKGDRSEVNQAYRADATGKLVTLKLAKGWKVVPFDDLPSKIPENTYFQPTRRNQPTMDGLFCKGKFVYLLQAKVGLEHGCKPETIQILATRFTKYTLVVVVVVPQGSGVVYRVPLKIVEMDRPPQFYVWEITQEDLQF